jgi:predicted  nucleic acid-binding Zn-ribbon protein
MPECEKCGDNFPGTPETCPTCGWRLVSYEDQEDE